MASPEPPTQPGFAVGPEFRENGPPDVLPPGVEELDSVAAENGEPFVVDDRFQIGPRISSDRSLAKGGAVVYSVVDLERADPSDKPDSAVKILRDDLDDGSGIRRNLGTIEMEINAGLPPHRNIARHLGQGAFETPDGEEFRYIATEMTNHGTLTRWRSLPPDQLEGIFDGIAHGLAHVHEFGLVHGDIKLGNIGLQQGEDGEVTTRLLDFGAARPENNDIDRMGIEHSEEFERALLRLVERGVISSSEGYESPERYTGKAPVTARDDMWALGCLIRKVSDLSETIGSYTVSETDEVIQETPPPNPATLPSRVPRGLGLVFQGCLQIDPDKRITPHQAAQILA